MTAGAVASGATADAPDDRVIEFRGVARTFGSNPPVYALRRVDLTIKRGEWLTIVGPSGSGKSTMLNILGLLDRQSEGTYLFEGEDVGALRDLDRTGLRARKIGLVFQSFHLMPHRTVLENVMIAELYRGSPRQGRRERAREALNRVGLEDRADFLPTQLSGGQQQRTAVARALIGQPALLLCDEPTGNLDSHTTRSLLDMFDELNDDGLTLVVITHDDDVAKRGSRSVRIVDGLLSEMSS